MSGRYHRDQRPRGSRCSHRQEGPISYMAWVPEVNSYVTFRSRGEYQAAANDGSLVDFIDDFNAGRVTGEPVGRVLDRPAYAAQRAQGRPVGGGPEAGLNATLYEQLLEVLRGQRADMARMNELVAGMHRDIHGARDEANEAEGDPEQTA